VFLTGNGDCVVAAASGMNITIAPGTVVVPNSSGSGSYRVYNPTSQTLTVTTAPVSPNNRIDLVCATVVDNGNSSSFGEIQIVAGTPAVSPSAPATPTNSIALAQVFVGFGVVSINSGNITDVRPFTAAPGGVIVCPSMGSLPGGDVGTIGYDVVNGRFFMLSATGAKPFKIFGFPATRHVLSTNQTIAGHTGAGQTFTTLTTVNVTTDGSTDIQIDTHWPGLFMTSPTKTQLGLQILLDGTLIDEIDLALGFDATTYASFGGHSILHTGADMGNTPSAGTHTITWRAFTSAQSAATNVTMNCSTSNFAYLRVQPLVA
jgi:hypothetical protein